MIQILDLLALLALVVVPLCTVLLDQKDSMLLCLESHRLPELSALDLESLMIFVERGVLVVGVFPLYVTA